MSSKRALLEKVQGKKPFYALPREHKSSAEIIREAKAAIRKMETHRPFTPCDKNRILFGDKRKISRPSSSVSLRSVAYDPTEKKTSALKLLPIGIQKVKSNQQIEPLHLEPTVIKTPLINRPPCSKKTELKQNKSLDFKKESLPSSFPPITEYDKGVPDEAKNMEKKPVLSSESFFTPAETKQCIIEDQNCSESNDSGTPTNENSIAHSERSLSDTYDLFSPVQQSDYSITENEDSETLQFSVELSKILPVLEYDYIDEKKEQFIIETMSRLYKLLEESRMFGQTFGQRCTLLKSLYHLLDVNNPVLSLHAAKLILALKVSDKNLLNVFKYLYKISRDEKNDKAFLDCKILGHFMDSIQTLHPSHDSDALVYVMATIKFLADNDMLLNHLSNSNCAEILLAHLSVINDMIEMDDEINDNYANVLVQLTTALRKLAENLLACEILINNGTLHQLCNTLKICAEDVDIVLPTMRLVSKLANESKGCQVIASCQDIFNTFTNIFKLHKQHLDIIVRVSFIVGNLLSVDKEISLHFFEEAEFLDTLLSVLNDYVQMDIKRKNIGFQRICHKENLSTFGETEWDQDIPDVIVKIVRILANMCLNPDVGYSMAFHNNYMKHLVSILDSFAYEETSDEENWDALGSILVAVNNVTYFMADGDEVSLWLTRIAEKILPFLEEMYTLDVRVEACNILGNLTRTADVRLYLFEKKSLSTFMELLNGQDRILVYATYGILMNLLIDKYMRKSFYTEGGLIKLLHSFHLCLSRDWQMAALICQILWNYCGGGDTHVPLTNIEVKHLMKVLAFSLDKSTVLEIDEDTKHFWEEEFYPVASNLLEILKVSTCLS